MILELVITEVDLMITSNGDVSRYYIYLHEVSSDSLLPRALILYVVKILIKKIPSPLV